MTNHNQLLYRWKAVVSVALCAIGWLLLFPRPGLAKDAGDLLQQYLDGKVTQNEMLALVEIVSVERDAVPEGRWKETGTLNLVTIEAVGEDLPAQFSVRYQCRDRPSKDAWTWDQASLEKGKRLLGFFNSWNGSWGVRGDGRTNVINNPEQIEPELLEKAQALFKMQLVESDLEVQIARCFRGLVRVGGDNLHDELHVIVRNRSQKPVVIWDQWNMWGYHTLTLQGNWEDGKPFRWNRFGGQVWYNNTADPIELAPGESYVFDVRLAPTDPKNVKSNSWGPVDTQDEFPKVKLRAVFSIKEDGFSRKLNVWTGSVVSPTVELRLTR